jgi:D-3-phosphoglycerate dehydrogenase
MTARIKLETYWSYRIWVRAGVVDEAAVVDLLKSGHIAHYATDAFSHEPPTAHDPLLALENVTLSADAGYNTP